MRPLLTALVLLLGPLPALADGPQAPGFVPFEASQGVDPGAAEPEEGEPTPPLVRAPESQVCEEGTAPCEEPVASPRKPRPASAPSGGGLNLSGLKVGSCGGSGGGEAALLVAVIAVAAAPIVIYAVDGPPTPEAKEAWRAPGASLRLHSLYTGGSDVTLGLTTTSTLGPVGLEANAERAVPGRFYTLSGALLLRPPPKMHIEAAFALGLRRTASELETRTGLELAVPYRVLFVPRRNRGHALYLRPAVFFGEEGIDARLDLGLDLAVGPLEAQLGMRAFSFDESVEVGFFAGLGGRLRRT
ncbi:MAG: hypothetical protein P1V51_13225 [Deltaproteobacteria bacterium]|nr:hypothetical protein [Deltaproteobacteria bacterium]